MLTALILANLVLPVFANAESLDALNKQESELSNQASDLTSQISSATEEAEQTFSEVENLRTTVAENQEKLILTQGEIETTQSTIEKRKDTVAERMKDMQLSGSSDRSWQVLLEADSFSDFINRAYAMNVLQSAEKEKVDDLNNEKAKLETLQKELSDTQKALEEDQASLEQKAEIYLEQVSSLKQQFADNQDALAGVLQSKQTEQERIAAEEAKEAERLRQEEIARQEQANQAEVIQTDTGSGNQNSPSTGGNTGNNVTPPSTGGGNNGGGAVTEASESAAKEWIAMKESGGSYTAVSPSGKHYGRYQLLREYLNGDLSPENQERVADSYVSGRYGSWVAAKAFHLSNGWY